jgi:transposase
LAVTRDGLPVRHWVFPGHTVDVTTVTQVKDDLRGWKLSRCVFVGDAGMVSQENLKTLSERVAYLLAADNVSAPLLTRLRGVNQPVIRT